MSCFRQLPFGKGSLTCLKIKSSLKQAENPHKQIKSPKHTQIKKNPTGNQPRNTWPVGQCRLSLINLLACKRSIWIWVAAFHLASHRGRQKRIVTCCNASGDKYTQECNFPFYVIASHQEMWCFSGDYNKPHPSLQSCCSLLFASL